MLSVFIGLIGCCLLVANGTKDKSDFEKGAAVLVEGLDTWYNTDSGLWETTSWWNGANVLTALIQYGEYSGDGAIKEMVANTFEKTKEFEVAAQDGKAAWICKNYINEYYDDEGWWALAWLDAWEWTGDSEYLEMSRLIFKDITTGWNGECGGGLYWKKGLSYKGTISNGLAFTLASRLHLAGTGEINGRNCMQWSIDIWQWMMDSNLLNGLGLVQDGIKNTEGSCDPVGSVWTYNQGVVLTGLVNLNRITGDGHYMESAHKIAEATIAHMTTKNGVLKEILCEPDKCNSDAEQFKGIFMRHLSVLNHYSHQKKYAVFLRNNALSIFTNAMEKGKRLPGVSWYLTSEGTNAATTASALDAFNAVLPIK